MKTPVLNNDEMSVESYGRKSHLTPKEYGILKLLINNPGRAFTSDEIYERKVRTNYLTSLSSIKFVSEIIQSLQIVREGAE